ncbi:isoform 2 of ankyrin repeat domain-containing protein 50 [Aspergillus udagawae]|nr:isoform 2 of ankyrin repeat domain-containing protein 50 [Aspergillus udagawae]
MPSCNPFSGLKAKFSKRKRGQDAPKAQIEPKSENGNNASSAAVPSGQLASAAPLATETITSPDEEPEKGSIPPRGPPVKDRWRDAFSQLPPAKQAVLKEMGFGNPKSGSMESSIKDLVGEVNRKQEECMKKFWHVNVGGKKIVLREYTTQIVGWLEKAGDIAVQFAPPQASLPWDLVKSMMKIPVNESEQMGALLATTERVVRITSRGQVYENVYLPQDPDAELSPVQTNLEAALITIYKTALDLLAESGKLLSANTARRTLEAIVNPGKAEGNLSSLGEQEDELLRDVQACESQRSSDSDKRANAMLDALQAPMARVDEGVHHLLKHMSESERIELLEWISPIPFGKHHDNVKEKRTPGTGEWLLQHKDFCSWDSTKSSALFWLQGNPGTGKTYLTSAVIDWVRSQTSKPPNDEGFAFFYCGRDESRSQPLTILQSFVRQLSTTASNPEAMQAKLQESCKKARENGTNLRLEQCKEQILASLNIYPRTTLVIDALDECASATRYQLIEALQSFLSESNHVVRIFISSRPDPNIEYQLESRPNVCIRADDSLDDLRKFLLEELDRLTKTAPFLNPLKPDIIGKLLERCQGMFQWAALQIHQIAKCQSRAGVWERLENLPEDLQKAYDEVWRQVENQGKSEQTITKRALRWVMSASEPMSTVEILAAIRVSPDGDLLPLNDTVDEQGLVSLCNNFLALDSQLKVWRFPHLSVREYLETKEDWSVSHAHYHAASACLSYFVMKYEYDDLELDAKLEANLELESEKPGDTEGPEKPAQSDDGFHTLHPFHIYMRHSWSHHVNGARGIETTKLASLLKTFLGSPNKSSVQYQRWHQRTGNDFGKLSDTPHFRHYMTEEAKITFRELCPGDAAVFAMCSFSLATIVWDWWEHAEIDIFRVNDSGHNLLAIAAWAGCLPICEKVVQKLVDEGVDVNAQREFYSIALQAASYRGHERIVQLLLDRGADANAHGEEYGSALLVASLLGHQKIVQMLLDRGADANAQAGASEYCADFGNALQAASYEGYASVVQMLLDRGADIHTKGGRYGTALQAASVQGQERIVQMLLERGADVNAQGGDSGSALLMASLQGHEKVVEMLLDRGADVNARNRFFGNALHAAIHYDRQRMVQMLLDRGSNIDVGGVFGNVQQAALLRGNKEVIQMLRDRGADIKIEDNELSPT